MSVFNVTTKLWPSGASLDIGTDSTSVTVPPLVSFDREAANYVSSPDGTANYQFLFWNTGRHVTSIRHVHWDFSVGGWGVWTATKWCGTPTPGGSHTVTVDPFSLRDNALITGKGTAIDAAASTIPAGAYPYNGDDHLINTAPGAVKVAALDPFDELRFAGWNQLVWGGETGVFNETDAGAQPGDPYFYPTGGGTLDVAKNGSAVALALYGNSSKRSPLNIDDILRRLGQIKTIPGPITIGDPAAWDLLRAGILEAYLEQTAPGVSTPVEFQTLTAAAPNMSLEQLRESLNSLQTTLALGNTALATVQAQIKAKAGKAKTGK